MEHLNFLKEETLNLLELKEEAVFEKIAKEKIRYYLKEASEIGKKEAKKYKGKDIKDLLLKNKVEVIRREKSPSKDFHLRGEITFDRNERKIIIYEDSINQVSSILKKYKINNKDIYDIHLAHEFYHFIEYSENKNTNELLDKVEVPLIGKIKRKMTLVKTREIAAHAFCKEFLNLSFHPKILDYAYLIENGKIDLNSFENYILNLEEDYLI